MTILVGVMETMEMAKDGGKEFKPCKKCNEMLNEQNVSKASSEIYRRICKPCRSKETVDYQKQHGDQRRSYANIYARRIGKVREDIPCLTCHKPCIRKAAKTFCSDVCRFFHYVEKTETCWLWTGAKNRSGYGKFCFRDIIHDTAHRVSHKLFIGLIDEDMSVCHTCDNPSCVNPEHLWLGTTLDNKLDQINKDRGGVKLNSAKVLEIRSLYSSGIGSNTIAKMYDVTCGTISSIVHRRIWKHV